MQINHDIQALKGHLKSQNFSLTFSLFPNEKRRPTDSQIEASSNENTEKGAAQAGGQISGWTDRYPFLLSSSHFNFSVHYNCKKNVV